MQPVYRTPSSTEVNHLRSIWDLYLPDYGGRSQEIFEALIEKYSEPHRAYHNVGHLIELFEAFDLYKDQFQDPKSVALALFFHDVIYDVPGPDNEYKSAEYARQALVELSVDDQTITKTARLIEMTKKHKPFDDDPDAALMLDMDITVLGNNPEKYERYYRAVEAEFTSHFTPEQYYHGRMQFLSSFARKERVFLTDDFQDRYASQVSRNLAAEQAYIQGRLDMLSAPSGPAA